jgi:hypothetical protein
MVYGNGEGVARNLPLARQSVCQYSGGIQSAKPADQLDSFNQTILNGKHYDVCEDEEGSFFGRSTNYGCQAVHIGKRSEEIRKLESSIEATSGPKVKASFAGLRGAWRAYNDAYGKMVSAQCAGGTGCGVISQGDDLEILETWLAALKSIKAGKAPAAGTSPTSFPQVDHELNAAYQQQLKDFQAVGADDCCTSQIREADRAWLKYREAWVRFGAARWTEIPADQWRAWQTVEWTSLLSQN